MSSDFWARALGQPPAPRSEPVPATRPWWDHPAHQPETAPQPPAEPVPMPTPAPRTSSGACPSCASSHYASPPTGGRARCFDCGYPLVQSGSGIPTPSTGTATPARQLSSAGYQPGTIVDRIG